MISDLHYLLNSRIQSIGTTHFFMLPESCVSDATDHIPDSETAHDLALIIVLPIVFYFTFPNTNIENYQLMIWYFISCVTAETTF